MAAKQRILVTNDDGIEAEGLWILAQAMAHVADVIVVAPLHDRTGSGTGMTIMRDLPVAEVTSPIAGVRAYSVDGTPGDCVSMTLREIAPDAIDIIASGVNYGANIGRGLLFSGTVGAAMMGHFRGLPSIAVSAEYWPGQPPHWTTVASVCRMLAAEAARGALPSDALLNVNVPAMEPHEVRGVRFARLAQGSFYRIREDYERGATPDMDAFERHPDTALAEEGTDIWALLNGYVSVTPIHADTTSYGHLERLAGEMTMMLESMD